MNIHLETVVVDDRARDGTWCTLPYPGHPRGCPKYPKCIETRPHFNEYPLHTWTAVVEKFDLALHARKMKIKHPLWSRRQCRNLLYWQGGVRKRLRENARKIARPVMGDVILEIPEANGVDVYKTMENHGLKLERDPDIVHKIMLVGQVD